MILIIVRIDIAQSKRICKVMLMCEKKNNDTLYFGPEGSQNPLKVFIKKFVYNLDICWITSLSYLNSYDQIDDNNLDNICGYDI